MPMETIPGPKTEAKLDAKERARQQRITELKEKIQRLEKELSSSNAKKEVDVVSRRQFLKAGSMALAGLLLTPSSSKEAVKTVKTDIILEKATLEQRKKDYILACLRIIDQRKYNEILNNAYLVSVLYYSEEAIQRMLKKAKLSAAEEIITTIYPYLTKDFREGYMQMLETAIKDAPINTPNSKPLDIIDNGHTINDNHQDAVDLFIKEGSPVYTVSSGVVVLAENSWTTEEMSTSSMRGGNVVIIYNPLNKSFYRYAHMLKTVPQAGSFIQSGAKIGIVGNTGINASKHGHGDHLHFEINKYDEKNGVMRAMSAHELRKQLEVIN